MQTLNPKNIRRMEYVYIYLSIFSVVTIILFDFWQIWRSLRPLVLGTLFRASSFRTRVLVVTSVSDVSQCSRGTFASSTKYLRQSSWPYLAAFAAQSTFTSSDIFLSSNEIFQDVHVTTPAACHCRFFSVSREGFTLSKRNRRQSRCPLIAASSHDLFFITRATIREAVLQHLEITFICCRY